MKVIKSNQYVPVSVEFETQQELDLIYHLLRYVSGSGNNRDILDDMRRSLYDAGAGLIKEYYEKYSGSVSVID